MKIIPREDKITYSPEVEAAIEGVSKRAGEEYKEAFLDVVRQLPVGTSFLVEDIHHSNPIKPHDLRAAGQAIREAKKLGLVACTGEAKRAKTSNLQLKPVWVKI